ncbi:response regulator [Paenibacillus sp. GCM10027627]|uniref:response regulator n=1 Tax=unclassified Paenibacillus TaxID=185978 RepID=UPI0036268B33
MKVILVDDEPVMHLIMRKMLLKLPEVQVTGAFTETESAAAFLKENDDIELAFVDISMPGGGGLSFAARLAEEGSGVQLVFVTSHKEFALEAYELSVLDYLVKPVSQERLERTVNRVLVGRASMRLAKEQSAKSAGMPGITVTALGDFSVQNERGRVKWISSKSAELFAYLLLHRGKRIARSRLIADIFGGMTQDSGNKYLNTIVYQMRKSLEPIGLKEAIRSENDGYVLELSGVQVDYVEFERRVGGRQAFEPEEAEALLQTERLYTGELFGSKAYVWAVHETERLAGMYSSFAKRLAELLLSIPRLLDAAKLLGKLHDQNPLDESVVSLLMKKHWQEGNKKALTAQYTDYVRLLSRELGIRPSKELLLQYDSFVSSPAEVKQP